MKHKFIVVLIVFCLACLTFTPVLAQEPSPSNPVDTDSLEPFGPMALSNDTITYQGLLQEAGSEAVGIYDFQFRVFNNAGGGTQVGSTVTVDNVSITTGIFTVQLNFGETVFTGEERWLEIAVKADASGIYTTLTPRQQITPAPMALALPGLWTRINATSPNLTGGYEGNSTNPLAVGQTIGGGGNSFNTNQTYDYYSTIGGGSGNRVGSNDGIVNNDNYATISGGYSNTISQEYGAIGGGRDNIASGMYTVISGGQLNNAVTNYATIGGGRNNTVMTNTYGTIAGGNSNTVGGQYGAVGGGTGNLVRGHYTTLGGGSGNQAMGQYNFIGGGQTNTSSNQYSTVGGGFENSASNLASTISGGALNHADGLYSTVGAGFSNEANGTNSVVGGGSNNTAAGTNSAILGGSGNSAFGDGSTAGGEGAIARHDGAFVWAGKQEKEGDTLSSIAPNQFVVRAPGGVWFGSGTTVTMPEGALLATDSGAYLTRGGTWANSSDRSLKTGFATINGQQVLEQLAHLPITSWNYISEGSDTLHVGPTAQDFYAAFGLGSDDKHIATVDADGIALAAIQGLHNQSITQAEQIATLEARLAGLEQGHPPVSFTPYLALVALAGLGAGWFLRGHLHQGKGASA